MKGRMYACGRPLGVKGIAGRHFRGRIVENIAQNEGLFMLQLLAEGRAARSPQIVSEDEKARGVQARRI